MRDLSVNVILITLIGSFLGNLLIVVITKRLKSLITDRLHIGPQTFHTNPTPRIGGIGILLGFLSVLVYLFFKDRVLFQFFLLLLVPSIPVFITGIVEDTTRSLDPRKRLLLIIVGSSLAFFFASVKIERVDIWGFDLLLGFPLVSFIFTMFALAGIVNAVNIIDGFNGLASMVSMMILLAVAYVSYKNGDYHLFLVCISFTGALAGFFLLNYPYGLIFMGDGGAYLTGFFIGMVSILLVYRNPEVSPWFAIMVNAYPIVETLFSMYRRKIMRNISPMEPDAIHLHTLFYKILVRKLLRTSNPMFRNPATSPLLWAFNLFAVYPAILFWNSTHNLLISFLVFSSLYIFIYFRLIRSKLPNWTKQ